MAISSGAVIFLPCASKCGMFGRVSANAARPHPPPPRKCLGTWLEKESSRCLLMRFFSLLVSCQISACLVGVVRMSPDCARSRCSSSDVRSYLGPRGFLTPYGSNSWRSFAMWVIGVVVVHVSALLCTAVVQSPHLSSGTVH